MYSLTFICDRILSPPRIHVRPGAHASGDATRGRRVLRFGHSHSSRPLSGPTSGRSADSERSALATGATARQMAVRPLAGVAVATSGLTSFTTRYIDSNTTG